MEKETVAVERNSVVKAFETLYDNYKRDDFQLRNIVATKEFETYCKVLKKNSPQMDQNELLTGVKVLSHLKIKSNTKLMQQLLHLLKDNINNLSLLQLAFLNLLLHNMESTPLIEAIKIAIPMIFKLHIAEQIDHENPDEVQKIFHHVTLTEMKVGVPALMNMISSLAIHGTSLSIDSSINILQSITRLPIQVIHEPVTIKLTTNILSNINSKETIIKDIGSLCSTLYRMIILYKQSKMQLDIFYNEKFFDKIVDIVINDDLGFDRAYSLVSIFNDISYVSYPLLDYIDRKIVQNDLILRNLSLSKLREIIVHFSNANYRSENWEIIKTIMHENSALHGELPVYIPILKLTADLLALGFVSRILLEKVLASEFLSEHIRFFNKTQNFSPLSYYRIIYQTIHLLYPEHVDLLPAKIFIDVAIDRLSLSYDENQKGVLEYIFGKNTVLTNVRTMYGHQLDFVINFDKGRQAVEVSKRIKNYEELPLQRVIPIAINFTQKNSFPINYPYKLKGVPDLRKRTLEKMDIKEVSISTIALNLLPDSEKLDFIEREIKYSLN